MKIALLADLKRREGDLKEFFLLRAIHMAASFLKAEAMIVCGSLCGDPKESPEFLEMVDASMKRRNLSMKVFWLRGETDPQENNTKFPDPEGELLAGIPLNAIPELAGEIPACAAPEFPFLTVELKDGTLSEKTLHSLILPGEWRGRLTDYHIHTNLAYCSENMSIPEALRIGALSGLKRINFAEHSGQLYFENDDYWAGRYLMRTRGTPEGSPLQLRVPEYRKLIRQYDDGSFSYGFEVDADPEGAPTLLPEDAAFAQIRLGSVHHLFRKEDPAALKREFLKKTEELLKSGVRILAHPFRIFPKGCGMEEPEELYAPVVELLRRYNVAAEINFHAGYRPNPEFFALCVKQGVKLSLGTDSHNLYEVGFLMPHLQLLRDINVYSRLDEVLI